LNDESRGSFSFTSKREESHFGQDEIAMVVSPFYILEI